MFEDCDGQVHPTSTRRGWGRGVLNSSLIGKGVSVGWFDVAVVALPRWGVRGEVGGNEVI